MAVYTEVGDDDLAAFLAHYDLGQALSFKGIAEGVENTNYLLHTERGHFILTLYEKRVDERDLPFFIGLIEHLSRRGVTCPQPVRMRDGQALGRLAGRTAALVTFLDGMSVKRPTARHCASVGEALAQLHHAGSDFRQSRDNALSLPGWVALFEAAQARANGVTPGLAEAIGAELAYLEREWPADLPGGVIHGDLFPDNVFFLGPDVSGLIDFYFACVDFFAYDVAVCLNAWCFEPDGSYNITKGMALLNGYERRRALTGQEFAALPVLARGSALRFLLTRLADWLDGAGGPLVRRKDPLEFAKRLRFHQKVLSAREYGLLR
jgi:homoserine kinase type II